MSARRKSRSGMRGAVMAEFVIAVVPLLGTFFSLYQVTRLETAKLMLTNAAVSGARTAAVTSNQHGNNPGVPRRDDDMPKRAVEQTLRPFIESKSFTDVEVEVTDASSLLDPSGPVRVRVSAKVACAVPMMGRVICKGPHKLLVAEATMPHQGATYADE